MVVEVEVVVDVVDVDVVEVVVVEVVVDGVVVEVVVVDVTIGSHLGGGPFHLPSMSHSKYDLPTITKLLSQRY